MALFKKIIIIAVIAIAFVGILAVVAVRFISSRALPDYDKTMAIEGLLKEVRVLRDSNAMPHIYAENEHDLYVATGYLMAQDRLWQMDLLRRVTMGRLSEIFGEDMVKTDHLLRALQMTKKSKMVLGRTDEQILLSLEAFAKGVNQYISDRGGALPPEFLILGYKPEPWEAYHTVNLIGYMAWDLSGSWQNEVILHQLRAKLSDDYLKALVPDLDFQKSFVHLEKTLNDSSFALLEGNQNLKVLGIEMISGSNNWAVTGKKSKSGKALMANDMHLAFGAPGIWYQMHQVIEGKLNVTGVALPGAPFIINGHNDSIAWGMTNLYVDEMDFYVEKTDSMHKNQYFYNSEWLPMTAIEEKIAIKGGDTVQKILWFTHHGPVISGFKGLDTETISMRWTGSDYSNELRSMYLLNRAFNWADFRNALTTMLAVSQNVVYADVHGNIGLQTAGAVPVRKSGIGIHLLPGDTDQFEWTGILPFDSLPYTFNPPEAFVSSANNRTVGPSYPYYIGYWYDNSSRIDRIREMIAEKEKLDAADFMAMQNDQKSVFAQKYLPLLVQTLSQVDTMETTKREVLDLIRSWDGTMSAENIRPSIFEMFFTHFLKRVMADEMGEKLFTSFPSGLMRHTFDYFWRNPQSVWMDNISTPDKETFEMMVQLAFSDAVKDIISLQGLEVSAWQWGKIHQLTLRHPMGKVELLNKVFHFNRGPYEVGGSFHTVNPFGYSFHKPFDVVHGASQRHIFDMGDLRNSFMVIPTGISGIPASKFYCNQTSSFLKGKYFQDHFYQNDVEKNKRFEMRFQPSK